MSAGVGVRVGASASAAGEFPGRGVRFIPGTGARGPEPATCGRYELVDGAAAGTRATSAACVGVTGPEVIRGPAGVAGQLELGSRAGSDGAGVPVAAGRSDGVTGPRATSSTASMASAATSATSSAGNRLGVKAR